MDMILPIINLALSITALVLAICNFRNIKNSSTNKDKESGVTRNE